MQATLHTIGTAEPESASFDDVRSMRLHHAHVYLRRLQPFMLGVAVILTLVEIVVDADRVYGVDLLAFAGGIVLVTTAYVASWRVDALRVAMWSLWGLSALLAVFTIYAHRPHDAAMFLLWPVIGLAYFASARTAVGCAVASALFVIVAAQVSDGWVDPQPVPSAVYMILIAGLLVTFITTQGRRVERALESGMRRDRMALSLARGVRLSDDPANAIREIARTIGDATGADRAVVILLEHDDDYVADIADWQVDAEAPELELDVTSIDATLRHLVSTEHGALVDRDGAHLLAPVDSSVVLLRGDSSVEASMRALLHRLGARTGLIAPLPIGGRAVGAIVLAATGDHDWRTRALPLLEPLAPQLAAGLAQVVLVRDQRDALDSLERLDRMRDRLIANVSHELRTPLTSTIGFLETLLRTDVTFDAAQQVALMEHARDGGLRLLALVEDLLALGSTRPESLDLSPEPIGASALVEDAIRGIEVPADRRLVVHVDDDPLVRVDRNRMLQVLGNLVVNAVHHGDGLIEVRCHVHDAVALIDVVDEGEGVAPEHVHELFLPFATFSTRPDSTGLGLAICRTIVEAHGGAIDYDRVEGERTRFRVRIPTTPE